MLNPDGVVVSDEETAAFDAALTAFLRRQGMAPPRRLPLPRPFLHAWAATTFLQDVAPELAEVRERAAITRRVLGELEARQETEAAAAEREGAAAAAAGARAAAQWHSGAAAEVDFQGSMVQDAMGLD